MILEYFIASHHGTVVRGKLYNKVTNLLTKRLVFGGHRRPVVMVSDDELHGLSWGLTEEG